MAKVIGFEQACDVVRKLWLGYDCGEDVPCDPGQFHFRVEAHALPGSEEMVVVTIFADNKQWPVVRVSCPSVFVDVPDEPDLWEDLAYYSDTIAWANGLAAESLEFLIAAMTAAA